MGSACKILIIDDNIDAADLTAEILRMHGLNVQVAYGGVEGVVAARNDRPDVIFLDLGMPELDGYQVAMTLRADEAFRHVRIIALTAWGDSAVRQRTVEAGFDMHMTKPARFGELIAVCQ